MKILQWFCRIVAAVIMLQTLFFKFSAAPESVYIFTKVGMEPWGRIGSGVVELVSSLLLLWPAYTWLGALIGIGVIGGAIISHLTILGIDVMGDGGYLFFLALAVFVTCAVLLWMDKDKAIIQITAIKNKLFASA